MLHLSKIIVYIMIPHLCSIRQLIYIAYTHFIIVQHLLTHQRIIRMDHYAAKDWSSRHLIPYPNQAAQTGHISHE